MTHPWFDAGTRPRVLAHRGLVTSQMALDGMADNSFAAVAAAHAAGVVYVESDCHLTADGTVVLFHDPTLQRVAGDPRAVADVTERELERIMADRGGLITLPQALDAFPTLRFNLDVKSDAVAEPAGRVIGRHAGRVLVTSFSDARRVRALRAAHAAGGRPATGGGTAVIARVVAAASLHAPALAARVLAHVDALQVPEHRGRLRVLTPAFIGLAHAHGVEVHVWTVNNPADMRRLLASGVDGIITDRADAALRVVQGRA